MISTRSVRVGLLKLGKNDLIFIILPGSNNIWKLFIHLDMTLHFKKRKSFVSKN